MLMTCNFTENIILSKVFFMHFVEINYLLVFFINRSSDRKRLKDDFNPFMHNVVKRPNIP